MKTFLWSFILFAGLAGLSACDEDERVKIFGHPKEIMT